MSLTETVLAKIGGSVGWLLIKALTRVAVAIEAGVDTQREIHGLQPIFGGRPALSEARLSDGDAGERVEFDGPEPDGDLLRLDILTELAREHHVIIPEGADLIAIGKRRGWLNESGEVVQLPKGYGD